MVKILVHAKTKSHETKVEHLSQNEYIVSVSQLPVQGRANEAIVKALADYFGCAASNISLIRGHSAKIKTFEIDKDE